MTATGPIEGDTKNPVPVPGNALHFQTPFLTDIAQSATPTPGGPDADHLAGKGLGYTERPQGPMTTNCSMRTSSPVMAGRTRISV